MDNSEIDRACRALDWIRAWVRNTSEPETDWMVDLIESDLLWLRHMLEGQWKSPFGVDLTTPATSLFDTESGQSNTRDT